MIVELLSAAATAPNWADLGLVSGIDLGFFTLRFYSLAYIAGVIMAWWYLGRLVRQPGAPMAQRHIDDLVFNATIGILVGGRLGYVLAYRPEMLAEPLSVLKLWEGGMSLHGGLAGVLIGLILLCRKHGLSFLRVCDYVACATPSGLFFGRIANFVNGELWGRPTTAPTGMIFPQAGDMLPRHPTQLYEAGLEGIVLFIVLWLMFWRTDARYHPGKLFGTGLAFYAVARMLVELVRQPDLGLENLPWGLTMGQTLSIPMLIGGIYLIATAKGRRQRIEGFAGQAPVA